MSRRYNMEKRLKKAYKNYQEMYTKKKFEFSSRGWKMADNKMLTEAEYYRARLDEVEAGVTRNINRTIVSEQAYVYTSAQARRFKQAAEKMDLDWKDTSISELRRGIDVKNLSKFNENLNKMREEDPDRYEALFKKLEEAGVHIAHNNQAYISYEVFGSV